jgi:hypothetical protein
MLARRLKNLVAFAPHQCRLQYKLFQTSMPLFIMRDASSAFEKVFLPLSSGTVYACKNCNNMFIFMKSFVMPDEYYVAE